MASGQRCGLPARCAPNLPCSCHGRGPHAGSSPPAPDPEHAMQVYLPIAEMSVDAFLLMGIGFGVGWLSGLFGVGGGFLLTPLLILIGIPSPVAVASGANQTLGASVSGLIAQWRRSNVDAKMGGVLLAGGLVGPGPGLHLLPPPRRLR